MISVANFNALTNDFDTRQKSSYVYFLHQLGNHLFEAFFEFS